MCYFTYLNVPTQLPIHLATSPLAHLPTSAFLPPTYLPYLYLLTNSLMTYLSPPPLSNSVPTPPPTYLPVYLYPNPLPYLPTYAYLPTYPCIYLYPLPHLTYLYPIYLPLPAYPLTYLPSFTSLPTLPSTYLPMHLPLSTSFPTHAYTYLPPHPFTCLYSCL